MASYSAEKTRKQQRGESGAQLLARLSARTDLTDIDPTVFGNSPSPVTSSALSDTTHKVSSSGKIIEVYGSEGVGKSELVIHYVAKACTSSHWNGQEMGGLGAKAIIIDTDFKFSVLRLAIVLEKQIMAQLENLRRQSQKVDTLQMPQKNYSVHEKDISGTDRRDKKCDDAAHLMNADDSKILNQDTVTNLSDGAGYKTNCGADNNNTLPGSEDSQVRSPPTPNDVCVKEKCMSTQEETIPTPHDVEELVLDALSRVQVMRVSSSDELLVSLHSLEQSVSCDPRMSLVIIDSISAFYWTDKLADQDNASCTEMKMSPIVSVISKWASEFGLTFLVTKSALIGKKSGSNRDGDNDKNRYGGNTSDSKIQRTDCNVTEHVEFLGRSWSNLPVKRIVLTKNQDSLGRVERSAWCSVWPSPRTFTFVDDSLQFL